MRKLRVFSYNIHKGFSGGLKKYTLLKMRKELHKLHPDLIFLQEVQGHHSKHKRKISNWPSGSQFEYLAEELWPHFTYGKNAVYTDGHHGNAILSKFPIFSWENIDISQHRFEKRGVLHVVLEIAKGDPPLHAFCVHLGLFESDRRKQLNAIVRMVKSSVPKGSPLILAGDFNDWQKKAGAILHKKLNLEDAFLKTCGESPKTFPSIFPFLCLDRIYFRDLKIQEARIINKGPWPRLSDHIPLEAQFKTG